jgi:hypothetical protein
MARSKVKSTRRKAKMTIPLAIVAGFSVPAAKLYDEWTAYHLPTSVAREFSQIFIGYDWSNGTWSAKQLTMGALPVAAGFMIHKLAGKLGVNRMLASAGIPLLRI